LPSYLNTVCINIDVCRCISECVLRCSGEYVIFHGTPKYGEVQGSRAVRYGARFG